MPVMGHNVQPDVNDHLPVVGVEYTDGQTATLYIEQMYSKEEMELTVDEMHALRTQLLTAIEQVEKGNSHAA